MLGEVVITIIDLLMISAEEIKRGSQLHKEPGSNMGLL